MKNGVLGSNLKDFGPGAGGGGYSVGMKAQSLQIRPVSWRNFRRRFRRLLKVAQPERVGAGAARLAGAFFALGEPVRRSLAYSLVLDAGRMVADCGDDALDAYHRGMRRVRLKMRRHAMVMAF